MGKISFRISWALYKRHLLCQFSSYDLPQSGDDKNKEDLNAKPTSKIKRWQNQYLLTLE